MAVKAVKKTAPKPAEAGAAPQQHKAGKSKLKIILLILLLLGGGSGAYWYFSQPSGPAAPKPEVAKPPVFQPLDNFTVNLQLEESPQFLQTGITLRVVDKAAVELIKQRMPEVRNAVLLLLSARKASEILTVEGKRKLSTDIMIAINAIYDPAGAQSATTAKPPATPAAAPSDAPAADPAAAPAAPAPAAAPGTDAAAAATPPAIPESTEEPAAAEAETKPPGPVLEVLFTIFIVQ